METYNNFISQFEIFDNPQCKVGFHRHHIVPISQQTKPDNRQVYLTKAQHLWAHILYDKENGTKTANKLITDSHIKKDNIHCYEDCLPYNDIKEANTGKKHPGLNKGHIVSEETKQKISIGVKGNTNTKGLFWFNNGIKNIMSHSCPEGFVPGRLKF